MEPAPKRRGRPPLTEEQRAERRCRDCNVEDLTKFYDYLRYYCISCWRVRAIARAKQYRQVDIQTKLARGGCNTCKRPVTEDTVHHFEWNHRDPSEKSRNVSQLVNVPSKYEAEVAKCDLECLFCHADITKAQIAAGGLFGRPRKYDV